MPHSLFFLRAFAMHISSVLGLCGGDRGALFPRDSEEGRGEKRVVLVNVPINIGVRLRNARSLRCGIVEP